eukprot:UC4_evm3s127
MANEQKKIATPSLEDHGHDQPVSTNTTDQNIQSNRQNKDPDENKDTNTKQAKVSATPYNTLYAKYSKMVKKSMLPNKSAQELADMMVTEEEFKKLRPNDDSDDSDDSLLTDRKKSRGGGSPSLWQSILNENNTSESDKDILSTLESLEEEGGKLALAPQWRANIKTYLQTLDDEAKEESSNDPTDNFMSLPAWENLASTYHDMGNYAKAVPYLRDVLKYRKQIHGSEDHRDVALAMLAIACNERKILPSRLDRALPMCQLALNMFKRIHGTNSKHPDIANAKFTLACLYCDFGMFEQALAMHREVLEMRCLLFGDGPDAAVASSLHEQGRTLYMAGRWEDSEKVLLACLAMREHLFGTSKVKDQSLAETQDYLAWVCKELDRLEEGLGYSIDSLNTRLKVYGERTIHPDSFKTIKFLVDASTEVGSYKESKAMCSHLLRQQEKWYKEISPDHPEVIATVQNYADILTGMGDHEKALQFNYSALEMLQRRHSSDPNNKAIIDAKTRVDKSVNFLTGKTSSGPLDAPVRALREAIYEFSEAAEEVDEADEEVDDIAAQKFSDSADKLSDELQFWGSAFGKKSSSEGEPRNEVKDRLQRKLANRKQPKESELNDADKSSTPQQKDTRSVDDLLAFLGEDTAIDNVEKGGKKSKKKKRGNKKQSRI